MRILLGLKTYLTLKFVNIFLYASKVDKKYII